MHSKDLVGQRFGKLLVIRASEERRCGKICFVCKCDCGNEKVLIGNNLGRSANSCGCVPKGKVIHGYARKGKKIKEYNVWVRMNQRCNDPASSDYMYYGGKGIKVCERWKSFESFLQDVGLRPFAKASLDRLSSAGNYEPGNVRWADQKMQCSNWSTRNKMIEFETFKGTESQAARAFGIKRSTLQKRLGAGWPIEKALAKVN